MTVFHPLREKLKALPVYGIVPQVIADVTAGTVTIVAARTGSGKSMMLPSALSDATDEQIVVLVPRRFLAIDAACNVAELSGTTLGQEVGFALGQVNGEKSLHVPTTKLLFCTYGYALRSGLVNTARTLVLDEVHEGDEQISLARAVLHARRQHDASVRILEMSATVNAQAQAAHWKDIAPTVIHQAEGSEHPCALIHESPMRAGSKDRTMEQVVIGLLDGKESGRMSNGIAVFRGGVKEVETMVVELKRQLRAEGIHQVEVVGIHSGTPSDERRAARLPPKAGHRKIIVGTNVIESGVNLLWVDAGVSDGVRKVPHHRNDSGADTLIAEDLPQAGVTQQMGRINRNPAATGFDQGIFILHAKNNFEQRRVQSGPAIERESMLAPAFHAASLGHKPTQLKWDIGSVHAPFLPQRLEQARQDLLRLELIHDDWTLTREGEFITTLPVSPETGAMLNEARWMDEQRLRAGQAARVVRDAVVLAAIIESRDMKLDSKDSYHGDQHSTSDLLDAMNAYRAITLQANQRHLLQPVLQQTTEEFLATATRAQLVALQEQRAVLEELCARYNMKLNNFIQTTQLATEIASRLHKNGDADACAIDGKYDATRYDELKRCILNGRVNQLFQCEYGGWRDLLRDVGHRKRDNGLAFNGYEIAASSIVNHAAPEGTLVTGNLREVLPKRRPEKGRDAPEPRGKKHEVAGSEPLLLLINVTVIPPSVFVAWAKDRAARFQPVIANGHLSPDGKLHANYVGLARFELTVPPPVRREAGFLVGEDSGTGHKKSKSKKRR